MLRLTLARDHLLCGYGTNRDPSVDLKFSGESAAGARPSIFFGPRRDALNLITKRLHHALVVRPKTLKDMQPRLHVLAFPGGDPEVSRIWQEQAQGLGQQIRPRVVCEDWQQTASVLESDADLYQQEFRSCGDLALQLRIHACIEGDALRESWQLSGLNADAYEAYLIYWYESEIGAGHEMQSTHFYEPVPALTAWRGQVCFALQALEGDQSLPMAFAECGTWQHEARTARRFADILRSIWARDELVGFAHAGTQASAASWLPLEPNSLAALGRADGIIAWHVPLQGSFELRFRLTENLDQLMQPMSPIEEALRHVREMDQTWLRSLKKAPAHVPDLQQKQYQRTLLTLKQMQDPTGGIIAAPEFHYNLTHCGGYAFCWGRDAGFISYAMDVCGMFAESARFYRYMQTCQSADGSFLHRHDMEGRLGASWGLLQPDETASVVFGFWQHVKLAENRALAEELKPMVEKAANWLSSSRHPLDPELPIPGFDLWEEREGVHYYSVAAMAAGLRAAIDLYSYMQWPVPSTWTERARELVALCNSERFVQTGRFARTLLRRVSPWQRSLIEEQGETLHLYRSPAGRPIYALEQDHVVDISQVAAVYPYEVLDLKKHRAAYNELLEDVMQRLWRAEAGGLGRYEADHYRDGNPWILTTIWLALAAVHQQDNESGPQEKQWQVARTAWQWTLEHIPAEGQLPEQVDPLSGRPSWVMPLTWSHAMFALAIQQLPKEVYS
jgi:GH15 family glucan-1,4-alpha-glucosidase